VSGPVARPHPRLARPATAEWLTPPEIVAALGPFDLDPCAPEWRPWDTARRHYTAADDGLALPWSGRVWLNPPYGPAVARWIRRLHDHGDGIALLFARVETAHFFDHVWGHADGILFPRGRFRFHRPDGSRAGWNGGAPSVLVAYGAENAARLSGSGIPGVYVPGRCVVARRGATA
jgi:hypothetical protein